VHNAQPLGGAHVLVGLDESDQQRIHQHMCGAPSLASTFVSAMPAARDTEVGALPPRGALAPM